MSYIVYNKATSKILCKKDGSKYYKTEVAARAGLTRASNGARTAPAKTINKDDYAIAESSVYYSGIEKTETVINLMSGKPVVQSVNTPRCLDVSSNLYWSM